MTKEEIIKTLRDMARYPTVTLPRDTEALKTAADLLAQPEQEPVAWIDIDENDVHSGLRYWSEPDNRHQVALCKCSPAQRTWVGLTDEEISEIAINNPPMVHEFARAIEAKLKEKNS